MCASEGPCSVESKSPFELRRGDIPTENCSRPFSVKMLHAEQIFRITGKSLISQHHFVIAELPHIPDKFGKFRRRRGNSWENPPNYGKRAPSVCRYPKKLMLKIEPLLSCKVGADKAKNETSESVELDRW